MKIILKRSYEDHNNIIKFRLKYDLNQPEKWGKMTLK